LTATATRGSRGTRRARSFARRWWASRCGAKSARAWSAKASGTCAKARTAAGATRTAGTSRTGAGKAGTSRMLGTRSAGELSGTALILETARATLRTRREAARSTLWTAIEDGLAALDSLASRVGVGSGSCRRRWRRRSLVDRARPGLGHDNLAHLNNRRRRRGNRSFWSGSRGNRRRCFCLSAYRTAAVACCQR
jgi:hypothetical protein